MQQFLIDNNKNDLNKIQNNYRPLLPYFDSFLPENLNGFQLEYNLRLWRNRSIIALCVQLSSTIAGFSFYFLRKARYVLYVNFISLILVFIGFQGVLRFQTKLIAVHGVITSSILGAVFMYSLLDLLFSSTQRQDHTDKQFMIIFSVPYLVDLCSGLVSFYLTYLILKQQEMHNNNLQEIPKPAENDDNLCVICYTNKRNTVFYKCGHKAVCSECGKTLKNNFRSECPICRQPIEDIIRQYDI